MCLHMCVASQIISIYAISIAKVFIIIFLLINVEKYIEVREKIIKIIEKSNIIHFLFE